MAATGYKGSVHPSIELVARSLAQNRDLSSDSDPSAVTAGSGRETNPAETINEPCWPQYSERFYRWPTADIFTVPLLNILIFDSTVRN